MSYTSSNKMPTFPMIGKLLNDVPTIPSSLAQPQDAMEQLINQGVKSVTGSLPISARPVRQLPISTPAVNTSNTSNTSNAAQLSPDQLQNAYDKILNGNGVQNPLNPYWQTNFHFRLFLTPDYDPAYWALMNKFPATTPSDIHNVIDSMPQVTLAETGVTTYNIQSVEIDTLCGPNSVSRNTNLTEMTIVISEPMGLGFQESIVAAAESLKIRNYQKHFFFLELSFVGYDDAGTFIHNPVSSLKLDGGNKWIWQIAVTTIDVRFDSGGGVYTIHAVPYAEANAFDSDIYKVPETINVGGSTLGDFTHNLAQKLNDSWKYRYANDVVTYGFKWHPLSGTLANIPHGMTTNPKDFHLTSKQPSLDSARMLSFKDEHGTPVAILQPGVTIAQMVEAAIESSEEAQKLAKMNQKTGSTDFTDNPNEAVQSIVYRIEPVVEIDETKHFEFYTQQYYRKITYHIWPYVTQAGLIDPSQPINALKPAVSIDAINKLLNGGLLKKHYDYIYTGKNTEVLNFEVAMKYAWNAEIPRLAGARASTDMVSFAARLAANLPLNDGDWSQAQADTKTEALKINNMIAFLQQSRSVVSKHIATIQNAIVAWQNDPSPDNKAAVVTAFGSATPDFNNLTVPADLRKQKAIIGNNIINQTDKVNRLINANTKLSGLNVHAQSKYSEVVLQQHDIANTSTAKETPRMLPVSFIQNWKDSFDNTGTATPTQSHRDKTVFGAVLGQIYSPEGLINLQMEIRGDPFWLGETNVARFARINDPNSTGLADPQKDIPEFLRGDNCIVVKFRAPERIGDDFSPVFKEDMIFSGIYRVNVVKHRFSDGIFKQELDGHRLMLIDIFKAAGYQAPDSQGNASDSRSSPNGASSVPGTNTSGPPAGQWIRSPQAKQMIDYLKTNGNWTTEQAVGIVANLGAESGLNANAIDGSNTSFGLAQWFDPTRQAMFRTVTGKSVQDSSVEQQLSFINWELNNTYAAAGESLRNTSSASQAASVFARQYEQPAQPDTAAAIRGGYANQLFNIYQSGSGS